MIGHYIRNEYFLKGFCSTKLQKWENRLQSWWHDQTSHQRWIVFSIVLFDYPTILETMERSWLDDQRRGQKWIGLSRILLDHSAIMKRVVTKLIEGSYITSEMNSSYYGFPRVPCNTRNDESKLDRTIAYHMRNQQLLAEVCSTKSHHGKSESRSWCVGEIWCDKWNISTKVELEYFATACY